MLTSFLFIATSIIMTALFIQDIKKIGFKDVVLSLFWVFTYFYFLSYFLNPLFLYIDNSLTLQLAIRPKEEYHIWAMLIALVFWLFAYIGYKGKIKSINIKNTRIDVSPKMLIIFSVLGILIYLNMHYEHIVNFLLNSSRINMFAYSDGNGLGVILQGLYKYAFFYYIVFYYIAIKVYKIKVNKIHLFVWGMLIVLLAFTSVLLGTRRALAIIFFAIIYLSVLLSKKQRPIVLYMLFFGILLSPFLSTILQAIRYMDLETFSFDTIVRVLDILKQITVSTFEGHWLAIYFEKTNLINLLVGHNPFEPLGNLLNYVPRFLWESKPYNMGILEIQSYLSPHSFNELGKPTITLPSTIIVEILYSYGLVVGVFIMFYIGVFLRFLNNVFKQHKNNAILVFVSICTYLYMFNCIRGGSAFIIGMIIPVLFLILITKRRKAI